MRIISMRPRKPERKKKERREWKEGIERKKERKEKGRGLFLDSQMIRISKMAITLIFFIWIHFLISFLFSFFLFISFSVFCFVFWRSFHQTVSATPALSSLILRQWNQKNVTKAPQDIIICKKSLFFTAVDLSMKVAMEKEKEKKNEKKKKI